MRRSQMRHLCLMIVFSLFATTAHAGGIVLEAYTGSRPDDAAAMIEPMLTELANRGFVGGYDVVGRKFDNDVSRPAIVLQGLPLDFRDQIESGYKAWTGGKFDEAVKLLNPMINAAHANAGAFADAPEQRELVLKALTAMALSQQRMGDPSAARSTFSELVRSFPDAKIGKAMYGPDAAALFDTVKHDAASGHGRLTIRVLNETAQVFIDERSDHSGTTVKDDLMPGDYRVFIRIGKQLSRTHQITLPPNGQVTVTIDLAYDQAIHTSLSWTGMTFSTAAERERSEAQYASQFAKGIGASAVAVVGLDQVRGRAAIIGALVNLTTGREIRRASLAADPPPPPDRVRALARFLAGDEPVKGLEVQVEGDTVATVPPPAVVPELRTAPPIDHPMPHERPWGTLKWITAAGAVGALGAGVVLFAYDGKCSTTQPAGTTCPKLYNNTAPAIAFSGVGVGLAALAIYMFTRTGDDSRTAFIAPTAGGAIAGFTTAF